MMAIERGQVRRVTCRISHFTRHMSRASHATHHTSNFTYQTPPTQTLHSSQLHVTRSTSHGISHFYGTAGVCAFGLMVSDNRDTLPITSHTSQGFKYEGEFRFDVPWGWGRMTEGGEVYEGEIRNGLKVSCDV